MNRAFSALNSDKRCTLRKIQRAEGPSDTSLVADPAKREGEAPGNGRKPGDQGLKARPIDF